MLETSHFETQRQARQFATSERTIVRSVFLAAVKGAFQDETGRKYWETLTEGNGTFQLEADRLLARFKDSAGPYQLKVKLPEPIDQANGITVRYRISGWDHLRYLAIGHTTSNGFRHVKISNPSQDEWVTFSVGYEDLAYHLANGWTASAPALINDVRLYISGTPSDGGAQIEFAWASVWFEHPAVHEVESPHPSSHPGLFNSLKRYFQRCNPSLNEHARLFLKTGLCPMTGNISLPWEVSSPTPAALSESGTYRYLWHAMQPAISLLVYGDNNNVPAAFYAARDYINSWLDHSYFSGRPDAKYTWYDHGTAERLLAFLLIHEIGLEQEFDFRFMERLRKAILSHSMLLESEVFYASHQSTRYHNHAWFQDIALLAASVAMPNLPCSSRWQSRAAERLKDQFRKLIAHDGPFSVFVENSIGYHHGVQRLVEFANEVVQLSGTKESDIPETARQLNAWSDFLRYPDKRTPSQGDTFRKPNPVEPGEHIKRGEPYAKPSTTVLRKAGYAVCKGNHDNIPFMLCMFATSLSKTHKHEDDLSITLFFDGIEWLLDPSFYSHDYTEEIPAFLRSARAHNRIVIDELKHAITPGSTRLLPLSDEGSVTGESDAYEGVRLTRSIKCGHESLSIEVQETISTTTPIENPYLVFHCGEGVRVSGIGRQITLSHPLSQYSLLIDLPPDADISIFEGEADGGDFHGIAGAGFMQHNPTALLRIGTHARSFSWLLKAYL